MKELLIGLLTLTSLSAFAFHPDDRDYLVNIGIGTKLKILKDINIPPNSYKKNIGGNCVLFLRSTKNFDRVLAADSILTIRHTEFSVNNIFRADQFTVDNANIYTIRCLASAAKGTSIGEFKESVKEAMEIQLADPERI